MCVEHLTGSTTVKETEQATGEEVNFFRQEEIMKPIGTPRKVISDIGFCFRSGLLVAFMESRGL